MNKKRKGLSPVIATVLLVALVIIIAAIIFLWARSFIKEAVQKNGLPADQACSEINLEATLSDKLYVTNRGNIPIYNLEVRKVTSDGKSNQVFTEVNLRAGGVGVYDVGSGVTSVEIVPTILGEGKSSKKEYVCDKYSVSADAE